MTEPAAPRTLTTLATYNERDNLEPLIAAIFVELPSAEILVIDDNSPDGTGVLADELAAKDPRIHVLHRPRKLGLGTATIDAMIYAIVHDYDYMLNLDADFSHPPRFIPALIAGMADRDVMIGSRYVAGGGAEGWGLKRRIMSRCINLYSRWLLGIPAFDTSGAFRCYRVEMLKLINFQRVISRGYSFQEEILYHCRRGGARIGETPILFENRKHGKSKINSKEALYALGILFYIAIARPDSRHPGQLSLPKDSRASSDAAHEAP